MRLLSHSPILLVSALLASTLACQILNFNIPQSNSTSPSSSPSTLTVETSTPKPIPTITPTLPLLVSTDENNPDEPVLITGEIYYTSPFFLNTIPASMVLLEDQAGFVQRDREFKFSRFGQIIGPVQVLDDQRLSYSLTLPSVPNGVLVDVDNDDDSDIGVQVFAVAYWSNTWGDPFLEERDAQGWSTAYASTLADSENEDELVGGTLIVWAPDANQSFPTEFGPDGLLFTQDDPVVVIPSGYSLVDLNEQPFRIYKEARPFLELNEGEVALNDYTSQNYLDAFKAMFDKVSIEYPFTEEKGIDWESLASKYTPLIARVHNDEDYYKALRDFSLEIPDGHINVSINPDVFFLESGGSFGLVLSELSDKRVIVSEVLPDTPGEKAGILPGAEIKEWDGEPVTQAIDEIVPRFGPYSTSHSYRLAQLVFLTRVFPDSSINCSFINPGETQTQTVNMSAVVEYDSLFRTFPNADLDQFELPVEGELLEESGFAYIRVLSFLGDYQLFARLWEFNIQKLIDDKIPGVIIDLRGNGGGRSDLPLQFAGYFFDETIPLYETAYFNETSGSFQISGSPYQIEPAPLLYEGPIAVLVSPDCVSACESFAYALATGGRSIIVGHYPTAGAFGEVGQGQYALPGDLNMQFPTGKSFSLEGNIIIEGIGVIPEIIVPVTMESVLGEKDTVLEAAIQALQQLIQ